MEKAIWVLVGLNILFLVASRMRRGAATDTGLTVEGAQAAMTRNKQERFQLVSRLMRNNKGASKIERDLVSAGLLIKPSEFYMVNLITLGLLFLVALFMLDSTFPNTGGLFSLVRRVGFMVGTVYLGWNLPRWILGFLAAKRKTKLEYQLADALAIISSSLRGGFSFVQGLDMASQQLEPPIKDEFARVIRLVQLGLETSRALEQMSERINSYDYDMTVSATNIQLSVGGNLSQMLDSIAATIRDRIRLRREIAALTAQGRISGAILIGLPIGIAMMLKVVNPEYMGLLFTTPEGGIALYIWAVMQGIGVYWIKKLLDFDN
jgi:tight adherence protein B